MSHLIVVMGRTRSGKDSIAEVVLEQIVGSLKVKFADPFKRYVEKAYCLPHGAMELAEYRQAKVPGTDKTFLDLMIGSYHAYQHLDPLFWKRETFTLVDTEIAKGTTLVFTDVRHPMEADYIAKLTSQGHTLTVISVYRPGCVEIVSDESLGRNFELLADVTDSVYAYINNGSLSQLQDWTTNVCHDMVVNRR